MKKSALLMFLMLSVCVNLQASENDSFACDSIKKTARGTPTANLVVYKDRSVSHKLIVTLGENLPTPYACTKDEGSVNNAKYVIYQCENSLIQKQAILSIDADNLDAILELEVNNKTYEMICELNPTLNR